MGHFDPVPPISPVFKWLAVAAVLALTALALSWLAVWALS